MKRLEKEQLVANLKDTFKTVSSLVLVHYRGLSVAELDELRKKLSEEEATIKVTKNSLASIALKDTPNEIVSDMLEGPTAIAWSANPIVAPKVLSNFAKTNKKLVIVGGVYDGKKLSSSDVATLGSLPPLDELRAKLVGLIVVPATKLAVLTQTPATAVARVINAYSQK